MVCKTAFIFFALCVAEFWAYKIVKTHLYVTLNGKDGLTKNTHMSHGITHRTHLVPDEMQAVLDMTNALRNKIAQGKERGSAVGLAPNATKMLPVEWDDAIAEYTQAHANLKTGKHSTLAFKQSNYSSQCDRCENLSGGVNALDEDMYGEVRDWDYVKQSCKPGAQCGHYNCLVAWANLRIGCGWQVWKEASGSDMSMMVCIFAGYNSGSLAMNEGQVRRRHQYEYITNLKKDGSNPPQVYAKTEPCSECPQGWDYCMEGGMCATKEQCESDPDNKCVCMNKKATCEGNGGSFDETNCRCKCPSNKYGLNCANECANDPHVSSCDYGCDGADVQQETLFLCHKTCGDCGKAVSKAYTYWMVDRKTRNKHKLKVRAVAPKARPAVPKDVSTKNLPNRGKCDNKESDYYCETARNRNYCNDTGKGDSMKHYCAKSCNSCDYKSKFFSGEGGEEVPAIEGSWKDVPAGSGESADYGNYESAGSSYY